MFELVRQNYIATLIALAIVAYPSMYLVRHAPGWVVSKKVTVRVALVALLVVIFAVPLFAGMLAPALIVTDLVMSLWAGESISDGAVGLIAGVAMLYWGFRVTLLFYKADPGRSVEPTIGLAFATAACGACLLPGELLRTTGATLGADMLPNLVIPALVLTVCDDWNLFFALQEASDAKMPWGPMRLRIALSVTAIMLSLWCCLRLDGVLAAVVLVTGLVATMFVRQAWKMR